VRSIDHSMGGEVGGGRGGGPKPRAPTAAASSGMRDLNQRTDDQSRDVLLLGIWQAQAAAHNPCLCSRAHVEGDKVEVLMGVACGAQRSAASCAF
jgi:hypothetical protein